MRVLHFIRVVLGAMVVVGLIGAAGVALLFVLPDGEGRSPQIATGQRAPPHRTLAAQLTPAARAFFKPPDFFARKPPGEPTAAECAAPANFAAAATDNAAGETAAVVSPFGKPETGWAVYAPLIGHEIGTACGAETPAFAAALAHWQTAHKLAAAEGRVDQATLSALGVAWLLRRPFVIAMKGGCPASPNEATLAKAAPAEAYGGKAVLARRGALDAYRRMVAAARAEITAPPPLLTIASAYRGPVEEAARCADGGCGTLAKAHCSAHRTGLAFDLYLGAAPGREAFSTADADRLYQSKTLAYRWLAQNAGRFGFTPYPFEPWHWEWTGEPV